MDGAVGGLIGAVGGWDRGGVYGAVGALGVGFRDGFAIEE